MSAEHREGGAAITVFLAGLFALFLLVLIWLPVGTTMLGLIEEWYYLAFYSQNEVVYIADGGSLMPRLQLRPLTILPFALAYELTPFSFKGWHALQILALTGKSTAMSLIAWWLFRSRRLALFAGMLFLVYPADTMQISLRALHINFAVTLCVSAVAVLLVSTEAHRQSVRVAGAVLAAGLILSSWLIYEAGLFLAPLPLLLWWARYGFAKGGQLLTKQVAAVGVWTLALAAAVSYLVAVGRSAGIYQAAVSSDPLHTAVVILSRVPLLFQVGLYRVYFQSWWDALRMLLSDGTAIPLVTAVVALLVAGMALRPNGRCERDLGFGLRVILVGVIASTLGYLPFLSSLDHVYITQRTYLYAALGGALTIAGIAWLSDRKGGRFFVVGMAFALVCVGAVQQRQQMSHYVDLSSKQRMLLAEITEAISGVPATSEILIVDESGYLGSTWMLRGQILGSALTYLRQMPTAPYVCAPPSMNWSSFVTNPNGATGDCVEESDRWVIGKNIDQEIAISKADLVRLRVEPDGTVHRLDMPEAAMTQSDQARAASILQCWPASACRAFSPGGLDRFHFDFGTWWSMEVAPWGSGWRDAGWTVPAISPASYSWMTSSDARLWFELEPRRENYRLKVLALNAISSEAEAEFSAKINGTDIGLVEIEPLNYRAEVPATLLKKGRNELIFSAPLDKTYGQSIALDWVDLAPLSEPE